MCGIFGALWRESVPASVIEARLQVGIERQRHRGPDGDGTWIEPQGRLGLAHVRLSIIDLTTGAQPMKSPETGCVITYNGEIYNYVELRREIGEELFETTSDTEVILRAYERWGPACVEKLQGMFAFAIWDAKLQKLFVARDRFGIKPFYYTISRGGFYFASEVKALTPFLAGVRTDTNALHDYFSFQFCLGEKTLFDGVRQLKPAHCGYVDAELTIVLRQYWEVQYALDWDHTEKYFVEQVRERLHDSVALHMRSDVEVGAYISGGVDSSLVAAMARNLDKSARFQGFTGKFSINDAFDESRYAQALADEHDIQLHQVDITEDDFVSDISRVIFHLDQPVAGPGSFPQYEVSRKVRDHVKVVLGGQGSDEMFGGYARYLIAYWEQCIKGALDGTMDNGNFIVTYESIIPNLRTLRNYKPLIQEFFSEGFFDSRDKRYYRLINRSNTFGNVVNWDMFDGIASSFDDFKEIFWGKNVGRESLFDSITHFDFKTLLPALLQVEDRMSMAHGIESRVPFLDHRLIELAATVPADVKFRNGELKRLLRLAFHDTLPQAIRERKDKMGFPVPLQLWLKQKGRAREFVLDTFNSAKARTREYLSPDFDIGRMMDQEGPFSRNIWAFLSLELWQQQFHDQHVSTLEG
ncbi:asparagine synthase (glutamine-hydrolyzing) [Bordetella bronchiseptica]|uniref:asparagine synthase (glutamine-hydrolyzing) n=1 Tax=Bordetella bronchiseptica TaxID=518 RepID=UPI0004610136|nr:asparagine synthase (glutamine-hydrolyzing) [Bordetella bronchiseptica]KAB1451554.1 asparagine synthase (glutamine-hydrolyzing) [Bordetella bronchiseptica]KAB1576798.1 asparagine synthase (glutamine-hydrolyzing) [Bordetella bronchiseptica]KDB67980.1 asparagine synthase (glutamine-hydrolyzing) [Bordetella bronchiseptica A1-7]KDB72871.1 asparagine synthase (glutamine-hydrolyzing) [Bordetella bronchiseptica B20-10725633]KDC75053.1 asparagine synthase (glutamine-hydrolyzing) [Bordetella bronchi